MIDASARLERDDALAQAAKVDKINATRGRGVVSFSMKQNPPDRKALLAHLLGPTGRLRAPTLRSGRTLIVGFNETMYRSVFAK